MKIISILIALVNIATVSYAEYSTLDAIELETKAQEIRKELNISTPTIAEKRLMQIRNELNLDFDTSSKEALLNTHSANSVQALTGVEKKENLTESISSTFESLKNKFSLSLKKEKKDDYNFEKYLSSFYETIGLDEGENWGMPTVFGFNTQSSSSSSSIPLFSDIQSTSTSIYKGMKHSGQSAELMSGMMYNSSKAYNTMFRLFDDSPFNIFDENEKNKGSIFNIFD
jgi:hypothetical protein